MKQLMLFAFVAVYLSACGAGADIKSAVKDRLKDPGSSNFKDVVISKDKNRACAIYNAKNSMGGYGDWAVAELKREEGMWKVVSMEGSPINCTDLGFNALDVSDKERVAAKSRAVEILMRVKNVNNSEADKMTYSGECAELVRDYVMYSSWLAETIARENTMRIEFVSKRKNYLQGKLDVGDCKSYDRHFSGVD